MRIQCSVFSIQCIFDLGFHSNRMFPGICAVHNLLSPN